MHWNAHVSHIRACAYICVFVTPHIEQRKGNIHTVNASKQPSILLNVWVTKIFLLFIFNSDIFYDTSAYTHRKEEEKIHEFTSVNSEAYAFSLLSRVFSVYGVLFLCFFLSLLTNSFHYNYYYCVHSIKRSGHWIGELRKQNIPCIQSFVSVRFWSDFC